MLRTLPGNTVARHASQPQATEIGRLGALPAPGVFSRVESKQALIILSEILHTMPHNRESAVDIAFVEHAEAAQNLKFVIMGQEEFRARA